MTGRRLGTVPLLAARRLLADRGGLAVSVLFYLLVSFALTSLWRAAAGVHGSVAGYSADALTWYMFFSEAAICAIEIQLIERLGQQISTGTVTVEMVRPRPVVLVWLLQESGRALGRCAVLLGVGVPVAVLVAGPPADPVGLLLAVPALALAIGANLCLQHLVAAAAFWIRDTRASWFLYQKLVFILGGMLLPLEVLPGPLRTVAFGSPFMTMAYVPARLAAGHDVQPALLAVQAGWLVLLAAAATAVFAAGQRRLQLVGG